MDREAWRATIHGVTKSRTQLKRLSTLHAHHVTSLCGVKVRSHAGATRPSYGLLPAAPTLPHLLRVFFLACFAPASKTLRFSWFLPQHRAFALTLYLCLNTTAPFHPKSTPERCFAPSPLSGLWSDVTLSMSSFLITPFKFPPHLCLSYYSPLPLPKMVPYGIHLFILFNVHFLH